MPSLLVVGATSDIARTTAYVFGKAGWDLLLAARDFERLKEIASDLHVRLDKEIPYYRYDVTDDNQTDVFWDSLDKKPDAVLIAVGSLDDQDKAKVDPVLADKLTKINYYGLIPLLIKIADVFEKRGNGSIIGISSVAGDRGRGSNYTYGAAKAALSAYLSGLRCRLAPKGIQVLTVKPGFVNTAMTEDMDLPKHLTASPEDVAQKIFKAVRNQNNVIYVKWYWRWIMFVVKALPEFIFKKIKF
jgi:short-subunit dehydrogenase